MTSITVYIMSKYRDMYRIAKKWYRYTPKRQTEHTARNAKPNPHAPKKAQPNILLSVQTPFSSLPGLSMGTFQGAPP